MKKLLTKSIGLLAASIMLLGCALFDDGTPVKYENLPNQIKSFMSTHFNGIEMSYAVREHGEYDVVLADGTELDFTRKCEWESIKCTAKAVPSSVMNLLPASVMEYINANFPGQKVSKVSKDSLRYEIELSNGLDIEFSKKGKFIRIDD